MRNNSTSQNSGRELAVRDTAGSRIGALRNQARDNSLNAEARLFLSIIAMLCNVLGPERRRTTVHLLLGVVKNVVGIRDRVTDEDMAFLRRKGLGAYACHPQTMIFHFVGGGEYSGATPTGGEIRANMPDYAKVIGDDGVSFNDAARFPIWAELGEQDAQALQDFFGILSAMHLQLKRATIQEVIFPLLRRLWNDRMDPHKIWVVRTYGQDLDLSGLSTDDPLAAAKAILAIVTEDDQEGGDHPLEVYGREFLGCTRAKPTLANIMFAFGLDKAVDKAHKAERLDTMRRVTLEEILGADRNDLCSMAAHLVVRGVDFNTASDDQLRNAVLVAWGKLTGNDVSEHLSKKAKDSDAKSDSGSNRGRRGGRRGGHANGAGNRDDTGKESGAKLGDDPEAKAALDKALADMKAKAKADDKRVAELLSMDHPSLVKTAKSAVVSGANSRWSRETLLSKVVEAEALQAAWSRANQ